MGGAGFDSFILIAGMRTGSNFLEANLNALGGVTCHGEAFNPHFIGRKDCSELLGIDLAQRDADPIALLEAMRRAGGMPGFRFFHDHDPRVLAHCLADRRCAKIVLTRNPLDSYLSLQIARETGQWKLGDVRRRRRAVVRFEPAGFERHVAEQTAFYRTVMQALQVSGQTALWLDYDDVQDLDVLNGIAAFLGVEGRLQAPVDSLKRQNPEDPAEKVENPAEMAAALAGRDWFDLGRVPGLEPRRGAAIGSWVAASGAGALYAPVRGGPERTVRRWLAALSVPGRAPGLRDGLSQKDLRRWLADWPASRSFTVLRHPLPRAWHVFHGQILTGARPQARAVLERFARIDLPPPGTPALPEEMAEAFLGFLRFLKANLAGQTAARIDPHWAGQSAVLQGFGQVKLPDFVLREEGLGRGLRSLAEEIGAPMPHLAVDPADSTPGLDRVVTDEMQAAVREAYPRDFALLGFGDWPG